MVVRWFIVLFAFVENYMLYCSANFQPRNERMQVMRFHWQTWVAVALCCIATSAIGQIPEENLSTNARFLMSARNADADGLKRALAQGAAVNARNRLGESA